MKAWSFLAGMAVAAVLGAAVVAYTRQGGHEATTPRAMATSTAPVPASPSALPAPVPSSTLALAAPSPVPAVFGGDRATGPSRAELTIDQAPEDPPPHGVDVTYAPSPNPPPLAPAGSETQIWEQFKSPEEKAAWEERERRAWEEKKTRELGLIVELLTRELGLTAMQTEGLRGILEAESKRRIEIATDLTEKRIGQSEFRDRVDASLAQGRRELQTLLSPDQYAKYQTLDPRRQALNDKTITGH